MSIDYRTRYFTAEPSEDVANEREARKDAAAARAKGHVSVRSATDVAHERYMRSMGL